MHLFNFQETCPKCGDRATNETDLSNHLQIAHGLFMCAKPCGKTFQLKSRLKRHQLSRKACLNFEDKEVNQCHFCDAKHGSLFLLNEHLRKGKCPKKYQCSVCESKPYFSKAFDLRIHNELNHGAFGDSGPSGNVAPVSFVTLKISVMGTSISVRAPRDCIEPGSNSQKKLQQVLKESLSQAGTTLLSPHHVQNAIQAQLTRVQM